MPWQVGGKSKGFLFLLLAVGAPQRSGSVPYMLLSSGGSKCVSVDAPRHTTLRVDYFVPDLMVEDEEELKLETDAVNSVSETEPRTEEGLDSRFNDYQKRRMELLKKAVRPVTLIANDCAYAFSSLPYRNVYMPVVGSVTVEKVTTQTFSCTSGRKAVHSIGGEKRTPRARGKFVNRSINALVPWNSAPARSTGQWKFVCSPIPPHGNFRLESPSM
jgi:hypothetical protein